MWLLGCRLLRRELLLRRLNKWLLLLDRSWLLGLLSGHRVAEATPVAPIVAAPCRCRFGGIRGRRCVHIQKIYHVCLVLRGLLLDLAVGLGGHLLIDTRRLRLLGLRLWLDGLRLLGVAAG